MSWICLHEPGILCSSDERPSSEGDTLERVTVELQVPLSVPIYSTTTLQL